MKSQYCLPKITLDYLEEKIDDAIVSPLLQSPPKEPLIVEPEIEISGITDLVKHIEGLIENAKLRGSQRTTWPDSLNQFPFLILKPFKNLILKVINILFKDQIEVNQNLTEGLQQSLLINQELIRQIVSLRHQSHRDLHNINHHQQALEQKITEKISDNSLKKIVQHLQELEARLVLQQQIMEQGLELTKCCLEKVEVKHEHLGTQIRDNKQSFLQHINYLRGELNQQKKLITLFLEEAYKRLPETFEQQQIATLFEENKHKLDAFYAAFE
ncbi:MAG: hypothetical protein WBM62_23780, partial [Crocosphaera sp.]